MAVRFQGGKAVPDRRGPKIDRHEVKRVAEAVALLEHTSRKLDQADPGDPNVQQLIAAVQRARQAFDQYRSTP